ncbi:MAG: hypothetical protein JSV44_05710 [Candidatus Zixiibacteriota bacterium]|nr:MAG: hypothetical protein JSV44_05710 [candidate division Zixibacteria bacterium]
MKRFSAAILFILVFRPAFPFQSPKESPAPPPGTRLLKATLIDEPNMQIAVHGVTTGNVSLTVTNIGQFGIGADESQIDPVTGIPAPSCVFPANSGIEHLYVGGFWIGAVVGRDTLVSIGVDDYYSVVEFWPDAYPRGGIKRRSIQPSSQFYSEDAVSEQDIIAFYTDTVTNPAFVGIDYRDGRPHVPLNIEVTQHSYVWSYSYAQDFILFDYSIKNIGHRELDEVYMAIYVDGDVHHESISGADAWSDDFCGFRREYPSDSPCGFIDTINIAYIADNDGDPSDQGTFTPASATSVAGVRVVRTPADSLQYSFNWWITNYYDPASDFGPRKAGTPTDPFRDMGGVLGTPLGDRNKYYIMKHREFDYDQLFTGKDHSPDGWLPPPSSASDFADGFDARYLLSFGPFEISPGEILPVSFAYVCGEFIHQNPRDFEDYFDHRNPELYYDRLDFRDLAVNSIWASWIYDNPGVDTNGDSTFGKKRICCLDTTRHIDNTVEPPETTYTYASCDTTYYEGDGIPDFRGASPPPPPVVRVLPELDEYQRGRLVLRWNGYASEQTRDMFSNDYDFEGYRVYQSLTPRASDFVLVSSYDREDYNRWARDPIRGTWKLLEPPFTLDSLRRIYGDDFNPLYYGVDNPLYVNNPGGTDSLYYFSKQDWNCSDLSDPNGIHKRFPEQPFPTTLDLATAALLYPDELTESGEFKYFEYEYILDNLLPSQLYYVSITAFDYGSPGFGLLALETSPLLNMIAEYPQNSAGLTEKAGLNVVVYPNPYRIDANYQSPGGGQFEGRNAPAGVTNPERLRAIHFMNLPHQCTIRIFSLDGDLVREIDHDYAPGDSRAMHETWDLITRNTQAIVSGIYYYSIESGFGNQIGKIVIIM